MLIIIKIIIRIENTIELNFCGNSFKERIKK